LTHSGHFAFATD